MSAEKYYKNKRSKILKFLPAGAKTFLDVGCAEGAFALEIKNHVPGAVVWGCEIVPEVAKIAEKNVDKIIVGDILDKISELPDDFFDCIVFNDSLEHMVDPYTLLDAIKNKIKVDGEVVASIPNIRHYKTLFKLVFCKDFRYADSGVMDRTHLRFFTQKSIHRLFKEAGYDNISVKGHSATKKIKVMLLVLLSLGWLNDIRYLQYVGKAKPVK